MFLEFQFSTALFARIVRNRIRLLDTCPDLELGTQVVDKVVARTSSDATTLQRETRLQLHDGLRTEVPAATLNTSVFSPKNLQQFTTRHLQLVQAFDIHLVGAAELEANGTAPTPSNPIGIRIAFNIALRPSNQTQGGGPAWLHYRVAWAHFGLLDPFIPEADRQQLEAALAATTLAPTMLDLSPIADLAGGPMRAINAGISLGSEGRTVALRIDFEVHETEPAVTEAFHANGAPGLLQGQAEQWAVLLDRDLLVANTRRRVDDALAGQGKVRRRWGPEVAWEPAAPRLRVTAGIEALGACPFFVKDIDLDVELEVTMGFAVTSPTELAIRFHVDAQAADTAELIGCAIVPALVWPFGGPLVLDELESDSPVGDYVAGLLLGVPAIVGQFASAVGTMAAKSLKAGAFGAHCVKQGDADVECRYPLLINAGDPAFPIRLQGAQVRGNPRGLLLAGPALASEVPDAPITVSTSPLEWTVMGGCRRGFAFVQQAQIRIESPGARGGVCSARAIGDPLGEFEVRVDRGAGLVTVVSRGVPAYQALAAKYPCKVRVVTTGGVRTLVYPPPAPITPQRERELEARRHNFERVCQAWRDTFHEIEWGGWGPPKPIDGPDWLQHWELAIHALRPGEWIDVQTDAGTPVLSAKASAEGVVHFAALFDGPRGPAALRLARRSAPADGAFATAPTLTPLQMVLVPRLHVPTDGREVTMRFDGPDAERRLTIDDDAGTRVFAFGTRGPGGLLQATAPAPAERRVGACAIPAEPRPPRVGGVARPVFERHAERAVLIDAGGAHGSEIVQVYAQPPWFEHTALGGRWVARWDERAGAVRVYEAVATRRDAEVPRREADAAR